MTFTRTIGIEHMERYGFLIKILLGPGNIKSLTKPKDFFCRYEKTRPKITFQIFLYRPNSNNFQFCKARIMFNPVKSYPRFYHTCQVRPYIEKTSGGTLKKKNIYTF